MQKSLFAREPSFKKKPFSLDFFFFFESSWSSSTVQRFNINYWFWWDINLNSFRNLSQYPKLVVLTGKMMTIKPTSIKTLNPTNCQKDRQDFAWILLPPNSTTYFENKFNTERPVTDFEIIDFNCIFNVNSPVGRKKKLAFKFLTVWSFNGNDIEI